MSLPSGAIRLNWIQSTGTQYVNTLVPHSATSNIVLKAEVSYDTVSLANQIMGFNGSGGNGIGISGATWWEASSIASAMVGTRYSLEYGVNGASWYRTVNGTSVSGSRGSYSFTTNLFLFAALGSATSTTMAYHCSCKLYGASVLVNGNLVRDFIPCKLSDGSVGLWDDVNSVFYGNAGTGTFTAGPAAEIVELEYIESTGTQYFDTGFQPNNNTRVVLDASVTSGSGNVALFGARTSATSNNYALLWSGTSTLRSDYNNAYSQTWTVDRTTRRIYDKNKETTTIDGVSQSYENATFQTPWNLMLLASNINGAVQMIASAKVYSCQIYDNGLLARDFIPAMTIEGEIGLYDQVFHEFYRNAGTGEFIAGPEKVTVPKAPTNFRVESETDTEVVLAWDASENAAGYLVRQSGMVIADTTELTVTAGIQLFGYYTFEVSAYNEYGESERSALAVFRTPDNPLLWLVTDRTAQDVADLNDKGVYNSIDLNRVGSAVNLLKRLLESAGFAVKVSPVISWEDSKWMSVSQAARYLADIEELRSKQAVLSATPQTPANMSQLTYAKANHIEQILLDVYAQYLTMLTTRVAAGTATSGGDYL